MGACSLIEWIQFEELDLCLGDFNSGFHGQNIVQITHHREHEAPRLEIYSVKVAVEMREEHDALVGFEVRLFDRQTQQIVARRVANDAEFSNVW